MILYLFDEIDPVPFHRGFPEVGSLFRDPKIHLFISLCPQLLDEEGIRFYLINDL